MKKVILASLVLVGASTAIAQGTMDMTGPMTGPGDGTGDMMGNVGNGGNGGGANGGNGGGAPAPMGGMGANGGMGPANGGMGPANGGMGGGPTAIPELDALGAPIALALVAGIGGIALERRRRKSKK